LIQSQIGAFFDMDKTIISENSGSIYFRESWERGAISPWNVARGIGAYLQYKLGTLDVQSWTTQMLSELKGQREATMLEEGRAIFEKRMARRIYPEAARLIAEHIASGHVVAIVSGSIRFLVEPLAESLSVEHVLCTQLEVVDGVLTGRCIEPVCLEEGKIHRLEGFVERHEIDLARSWFYSDSITDLPVLDRVGHPVATNPDSMLHRTATQRGWPVRHFEIPE
jgi:putative phosphoserine phosphatase/1-acylglycerol-3-phosphate O-acyltransferase